MKTAEQLGQLSVNVGSPLVGGPRARTDVTTLVRRQAATLHFFNYLPAVALLLVILALFLGGCANLSDGFDGHFGHLREVIGAKTEEWGVTVMSVEIRDVAIPVALQDAMSRQAQAEREKEARVILGSAEAEIAGKFVEAATIYADHPAALQLRAMNIIYETTKERGATILIPTSMVDSLNPASALVLAGQSPGLKSVA